MSKKLYLALRFLLTAASTVLGLWDGSEKEKNEISLRYGMFEIIYRYYLSKGQGTI